MKADAFLIQRPERQRPLQRATFAVMTIVAWALWVSLWLPVLTLLAWLLGLGDAYRQLNILHLHGQTSSLGMIAITAAACAMLFSVWAFYNRARFSKNRRRGAPATVEIAAMAEVLGARLETVELMRTHRRAVVRFSDAGRVYVSRTDH